MIHSKNSKINSTNNLLPSVLPQGTRVYISLVSKYNGKVEGLCGDYDGNYLNDFAELGSGKVAKTPNEFARLWKTSQSCPDPDLPDDFNPCNVIHFVCM